MREPAFASGAARQIRDYVRSGRASGSICDGYVYRLGLFDATCAADFPGSDGLTQDMVDRWCERRAGESANSCRARCYPVVSLVRFLRARSETDVVAPELPRRTETPLVHHAFTDDEIAAFFAECDSYRAHQGGGDVSLRNRYTMPVLFRLLYSSGIRTCEARKLARDRVDLERGVVEIVEGKGRSERVVALHPYMLELMRRYDALMEGLFPGRSYFFPNGAAGHLSSRCLSYHFKNLWERVSDEPATAYMLRHHYAVQNINSMVRGGIDGLDDLEYLSKSMGHVSIEETVGSYYHVAPALAERLQERCGAAFDLIVPEVSR